MPRGQLGVVGAIVEHFGQPRMHVRQVVALEEVVDVDLPVARELVAVAAQVAHRGQVDRRDAFGDAGVDLVERRHVVAQRHEHQALPFVHAQRRQADVLDLEVAGVLHLRRAAQLAGEGVGPAVVLAVQRLGALAVAQRERPRAVAADIWKCAQHAVLPAHQQHRHAGDLLDHVVARLGQQALVRHQLPAAREHRPLFHRQHGVAEVVTGRQGTRVVELFNHRVRLLHG